ncbi:hypothetical protein QOT17_010142 [Balamuthia mandrillaris]
MAFSPVYIALLAFFLGCAFAQENITYSDSGVCGGGNCLDGMQVSVTAVRLTACMSRVTFTFTPPAGGCSISHALFPVPKAGYLVPNEDLSSTRCNLTPESVDKDDNSIGKNCKAQQDYIATSPYNYMKINFGCEGTADLSMDIMSTGMNFGEIVIKAGQACELCSVSAPIPMIDVTCDDAFGDCDDDDPCTVDSCASVNGCQKVCQHDRIPNCGVCVDEVDCADQNSREINPCAYWRCSNTTGTCEQAFTPGCLPCSDSECVSPYGDSDKDCRKMKCGESGKCETYVDQSCCEDGWDGSGCLSCVTRVGCVYYTEEEYCSIPSEELDFIPGASSWGSFSDSGSFNWTTECPPGTDGWVGDGEGKSDGGDDDDTVAKGVGGALGAVGGLLAIGGIAAAAAVYTIQKAKERGIAKRLEMVGFSSEEQAFIMNNEMFDAGGMSGENPFFISRGDGGAMTLVPNSGA